jgi:TonB family protein
LVRPFSLFLVIPFALGAATVSPAKTAGGDRKVPTYSEVFDDLIAHPFPEYPAEARDKHVEGKGNYLIAFNSKTGLVQKVQIVHSSGSAALDKAAVDSLRRWRVKPQTLDKVYVPISFTLPAHQDDRTLSQTKRDVLYSPYPRFPAAYAFDFASAKGTFELQIDQTTGLVTSVRVLDTMGEDRLDIFASRTFRLWRFRPHTLSRFVVTMNVLNPETQQ